MGQNSHGKNPKTLTERVAEWDADHSRGQTDTHETFEGTSRGARYAREACEGVGDAGRIKKRMKARVGCASAAGYDCVGSCGWTVSF